MIQEKRLYELGSFLVTVLHRGHGVVRWLAACAAC